MRKVVVNTTPLIALSHIGQLDILKKMYGEILIWLLLMMPMQRNMLNT
jgi:predicted nucleic acid-binding protein